MVNAFNTDNLWRWWKKGIVFNIAMILVAIVIEMIAGAAGSVISFNREALLTISLGALFTWVVSPIVLGWVLEKVNSIIK